MRNYECRVCFLGIHELLTSVPSPGKEKEGVKRRRNPTLHPPGAGIARANTSSENLRLQANQGVITIIRRREG